MEKEVFEKMDQPSKMILTVYNPGQDIPSLCREISENCVEQIGESSNEVEGEGNQSELIINISQAHALLKLLDQSLKYRRSFLNQNQTTSHLIVKLVASDVFPVDHKSCDLSNRNLWLEIEREDALHWLSTLGGAFSNLGEHNVEFAKRAGDNAFRQMRIVQQIGDPSLFAVCWIFISMSLMQQKRLRASRKVLEWTFYKQKNLSGDLADLKVMKMCQGCWSRLKFHWQNRQRKNGYRNTATQMMELSLK